jgi:hypothetical protein
MKGILYVWVSGNILRTSGGQFILHGWPGMSVLELTGLESLVRSECVAEVVKHVR